MASSSILLFPLERLSRSGNFNVQKCVLVAKTSGGDNAGAKNGAMSPRRRIVCQSRGKGAAEHEMAKLKNVTQQMRLLLESEGLLATEAAYSLVGSMNREGRTALISALFPGKQCDNLIL